MRIIAGKYKGMSVDAPKGRDVRPTTDRVREGLFSSLISLYGQLDGTSVLDCFAGSGALGLEALSRGASSAYFFDNNSRSVANLKKNVFLLSETFDKCKIFQIDAFSNRILNILNGCKFDIVFLDPPYAYASSKVLNLISIFKNNKLIAENGVIIYEHDAKDKEDSFDKFGLNLVKSKKYGRIQADFIKLL